MLGFSVKPGHPHDNSLDNVHLKFRDGSALELITATRPATAPGALEHANTARGLHAVWLAGDRFDLLCLSSSVILPGRRIYQNGSKSNGGQADGHPIRPGRFRDTRESETQHTVSRPAKRCKASEEDIELGNSVDLIALAVKESALRCRILGTDREITLRSGDAWKVVPGEVVTVTPRKQWRFSGHPCASGDIESHRLDVPALGLTPLRLRPAGMWNPAKHYWGEEGEQLEEWAKPIFAHGPRSQFEMEHILPGQDPSDPFMDPILEASELQQAGDSMEAWKLLMELLSLDLRCLDAHAHLGNFAFEHKPEDALRYYEVGLRIGELSCGTDTDKVLPWGLIDNRPFLRCLHGYGLCLWRLEQADAAAGVFERMLWLNPSDNQGARFLLQQAREGLQYSEEF